MNEVYFYFRFGDKVFKYKTFGQCLYQLYRKVRVFRLRNGYFEFPAIFKQEGKFIKLYYIFDLNDYKFYKK